jgi:hypothetical protein
LFALSHQVLSAEDVSAPNDLVSSLSLLSFCLLLALFIFLLALQVFSLVSLIFGFSIFELY